MDPQATPPILAIVTSAEVAAPLDLTTIMMSVSSRGRGGSTTSSAPRLTPVPLLLTDEQVEAVRLTEKKGTLMLRESESEADAPTLDHAVLEELKAMSDLPASS